MEPVRITIPDAKPGPVASQAADIVMNLLRQEGIDLRKAIENPMVRQIIVGWRNGEHAEAQVRHMLRNLLILNPGLSATPS